MTGQRLDKWLWCARAVKTRSAATRLIADGKVRINGERVRKPSRIVQLGDVITATPPGRLVVWRVLDAADRRGPAPLARTLYEDLTPPIDETEGGPAREARVGARPTKRDRRRIDTLRAFWS
ncbi:RNA-binding S4 domain-containing protein [Methyloceanibacter stevinii]|uniref:RNA-binding S4 domain-containing protein n=1 Tax=Methyloceanibacter stevinii TaxID=1774970 RepID=UPI00084983E8|nr:RNA-binding S4 domain-containing protein [Methyloceanibacter stevinii]